MIYPSLLLRGICSWPGKYILMLDYNRNRRINGLEACLSIKSIKGRQGDVHLSSSLLLTCFGP